MNKMFDKIISGNSQYKVGLYLGIALILLSIAGGIKTPLFEFQYPYDWLFIFLIGCFIFFFFMGIALNTEEMTYINENTDEQGKVKRDKRSEFKTYLDRFNKLSRASFWICGIFASLSLIRLGFIIWK